MIISGTAYFKFRKSLIGPSMRLKSKDSEVLSTLMKGSICTKHYNKRMAKCLATIQVTIKNGNKVKLIKRYR